LPLKEAAEPMADVRVSCVNKQPRDNPHEGITHLGGTAGGGWRWTRAQVIESIRSRTNTFYTFEGGKRADIGIVEGQNGPYLRTYADGQWNDNLLALPECRG
jgi:hypothetical protein